MTFEEHQKRRALKRLATQLCAESQISRVAMNEAEQSTGKVMILVGAMLLTCLGWLAYSRWISPSSDSTAERPAHVVDSSNRSHLSSGNSGSALPMHRTSSAESNSSQGKGGTTAAAKVEPQTYDERLEARVAPLEEFARRGDPKAIPAVMDALHDEDWRVRSRAMDAAVNAYVPIPESALLDSAQSDPAPEVRFLALAGIAARVDPAIPQVPTIDPETARSLSRVALSDANEHVRWQAQQILDELDSSKAAPTEDQSQSATL